MIQSNVQLISTSGITTPLAESTITHRETSSETGIDDAIDRQSHRLSAKDRLNIAQAEWSKLFHSNPNHRKQTNRPLILTNENELSNNHWGDPVREKKAAQQEYTLLI
jgi:hypothetical protein